MLFHMPEIGSWGEEKHRLVQSYASIFATSMKNKWDYRVYIDLFSGAGRAKIKNTNKIIDGSPLLALNIPDSFDLYIFCEQDPQNIMALQQRVSADFPDRNIHIIEGDANNQVNTILSLIPQASSGFKVLTFCFVDPFKTGNLKFDTIKKLSSIFMDFLVLIPTGMDIQRNAGHYLRPNDQTIDGFLGCCDWRPEWIEAEQRGEKFWLFFIKRFCNSMANIGYIHSTADESVDIRLPEKNVSLYRLAFFSRNKLGQRFWADVKRLNSPQLGLF